MRGSNYGQSDRSQLSPVVHVIAPALIGGAEAVVRSLAIATQRGGGSAQVATLLQGQGDHPFLEQLQDAGVAVWPVRCGRRRYLMEVTAVSSVLRRSNARLVHTHVYHADFVGYMAARRCGIPVVATVHGFTGGDLKNRIYQRIDRLLLRRFDAVLCVSNELRVTMLRAGCDPAKVHVVPNGYLAVSTFSRENSRERLGLNATGFVVGWIGRLSHEKGPDLLVDALATLDVPDAVAVLIGDGPERANLEQQIRRSQLSPARVRLAGYREDAARLLSAFDVLVISSRTEGLPIVLLEAMSAGVPVVAFGVGGMPEVLDRSTGWLIQAEDARALGSALVEVRQQEAEAKRRAAAARELVTNRFGPEGWLKRLDEVYAEVLGT